MVLSVMELSFFSPLLKLQFPKLLLLHVRPTVVPISLWDPNIFAEMSIMLGLVQKLL